MPRIDPNQCTVQDPYRLFAAMLRLINPECVANMRQHIGQLNTKRLENLCSEEIVFRQKAQTEAEFKASAERAVQPL